MSRVILKSSGRSQGLLATRGVAAPVIGQLWIYPYAEHGSQVLRVEKIDTAADEVLLRPHRAPRSSTRTVAVSDLRLSGRLCVGQIGQEQQEVWA